MAIAFGTQTQTTGSSATSKAANVPTGTAANDIIVAALYIESTATITAPSGFTQATASPISTTSGDIFTERVFWKRPTGADAGTYSFSWTGSAYAQLFCLRYTGCITSGSPWDTGAGAPVSAQRSSAGTTMPAVSLTTQGADRMLVYLSMGFQVGTYTAPSGFNARVTTDVGLADKIQAAAGSTGSISGSGPSGTQTAWMGALIPPATPSTSRLFLPF